MTLKISQITRAWLLALLAFPGPAVAEIPYAVLYHEPLQLAGGKIDSFDAFGRRFELIVEPNRKLARLLRDQNVELLKGEIANSPGSWIRLTRRGSLLSGIIREGGDVYMIAPRDEIFASLLDPAASDRSANVIYRLTDTVMSASALSCGANMPAATHGRAVMSGQAAFDDLMTELSSAPTATALGATRRITVGAIGDFELHDYFIRRGADPHDELLSRFNIVDGIYTDAFDLEIFVADLVVFSTAADPFTSTDIAFDLLDEVEDYRRGRLGNPGQLNLGLTHLVTGRNLANNIAGIAFIGQPGTFGACTGSGASLAENDFDANYTALLIAHEIGHNLGALHDDEMPQSSTGALCPADVYIMSATIHRSVSGFSACSIEDIGAFVGAVGCVSTIPTVDLVLDNPMEASLPGPLTVPLGGEFTLTSPITNVGSTASTDFTTQLSFDAPAALTLVSLELTGGTCDLTTASCTRAGLASGAGTVIAARMNSSMEGPVTISQSVTTADDIDASTNSWSVDVVVESKPNLQIGISGPRFLLLDDSSPGFVLVFNNSSSTATGLGLDLTTTANIAVADVISADASCGPGQSGADWTCTLPALRGGEEFSIDFTVTGNGVGPGALTAEVTADQADTDPSQNIKVLSIEIARPSSGGGGSAVSGFFIAALIMAGWLSGLRRPSQQQSAEIDDGFPGQ